MYVDDSSRTLVGVSLTVFVVPSNELDDGMVAPLASVSAMRTLEPTIALPKVAVTAVEVEAAVAPAAGVEVVTAGAAFESA